jgi:dienelactone hydrolase
MTSNRRGFLKLTGMAGVGLAGTSLIHGFPMSRENRKGERPVSVFSNETQRARQEAPGVRQELDPQAPDRVETEASLIGLYGPWAADLMESELPRVSFRRKDRKNIEKWRPAAKRRLKERMSIPDIGRAPEVNLRRQYVYDDLHIEELTWELPYGRPTEAVLLKPANAAGPLPAILAFHDHGGNKYFGTRKITKTSDDQHPMMAEHQKTYYGGFAWANEIARRGYVVLVPDAFLFASRRVLMRDVPASLRQGLNDLDPERPENIATYNNWAAQHEHTMAKSLFSAGITWPGVFFAEDRIALDILSSRRDVDAARIGCGGLSGGGLRTVFMGGLDERIKCAVPVGFMTTWRDFVLNKSVNHTWMTYVPLLPYELDFPEILGLRAPLPALVLNNRGDELFTLPEMKRADGILREVYEKAGAGDRYRCSFHPGPHKFDASMQAEAFQWFDKWLKPE